MYMQWRKDGGSTSSSRTLIITYLPRFEKLALTQFQLYIKAQTTTQCFVCCNCRKTIISRSDEGKEKVLCVLHILRIHTGLQKWSRTNVYDLHIKQLIYLISVYHALILQRVNCYLNNIECLLIW